MYEHWTSSDPRSGPRPVILLMYDGAKALIRSRTGRAVWIAAARVHETRQQAYVAVRRANALRYWQRQLRYERTKVAA